MSILTRLASRLRSLRERHGVTQEQFAECAGLSYKFYQSIEAGRKKQLWLETVERLAAGFGVEAWELLGPEEPAHTVLLAARPSAEARAVAEAPGKYRARKPGRPVKERRKKS